MTTVPRLSDAQRLLWLLREHLPVWPERKETR
jgi:hypothetical protein